MSDLAERLRVFLARRLPDAREITVGDLTRLPGGYSRLMTRFTATIDGRPRTLVLRADAPDSAAPIETDRVQEWRLLDALTRTGGAPMPDALFADTDGSELGSRAIVLDFVPGGPFLSSVRASGPGRVPAHARAVADLAADVHAVDTTGLPGHLERPDWNGYIDDLIQLWRDTEARLSESLPMLRYVAAWLERNRPPEAPMGLVHGEFQPGNMMIGEGGRLVAVDWEFAHLGDPREDLGWLTYVEAIQPPALFGADPAAFCTRYRERTGLGEDVVNPLTVAYFSILPAIRVFGQLLRTQQDYVDGRNTDLRTAFLFNADITAFEGWFAATRALDAARTGVPA
ncbi:phosphotransferase family protein [Pseudonocardia eucalypti]|uniref:Phosphotransferase family protein n=1 Tax=Pseudonocardia eucalypti TaxID=648755 RepID=A0ABP9PSL9_9PSEU|nr:aminoglycoside phosphotransferase (APT) family kinase protein [Pseudonocardia eucalypti]